MVNICSKREACEAVKTPSKLFIDSAQYLFTRPLKNIIKSKNSRYLLIIDRGYTLFELSSTFLYTANSLLLQFKALL